MIRRTFWKIIARVVSLLVSVGGAALALHFSIRTSTPSAIACIIGLVVGMLFADVVHELGHIAFAKAANMRVVYAKMLCFRFQIQNGKMRVSFASPFSEGETQAIPKSGENMQNRAKKYILGGLVFSAAFLVIVLAAALTLTLLGKTSYLLWGLLPYTSYLFLLNAFPVEYASGKTDAAIYQGVKKGEPAEKTMLAAMEIQGRLYAGESYGEIDENLYFDLPQLPEDEPLFAIILDLRYRYYLDKADYDNAANCLNRLANAEEYLPETYIPALLGEFVYMHAINGDKTRAENCKQACEDYLSQETAKAKRITAAYVALQGDKQTASTLCDQAKELLAEEIVVGERALENKLLERIKSA